MKTCVICRFDTEFEDVVTTLPSGRCVCLHCYDEEAGRNERRPIKNQRRRLEEAMAGW
jgi:hypothetical protein